MKIPFIIVILHLRQYVYTNLKGCESVTLIVLPYDVYMRQQNTISMLNFCQSKTKKMCLKKSKND